MRRLGIIAVLSLIVTALAAVPALAQTVTPTEITRTGGLHFCEGTTPTVTATKTDQEAFLTTNFSVCGAGTTAAATLSANAEVVRGCITPSGSNRPRGLQRSFTTVTGSETFQTRQGRADVTGLRTNSITAAPFECPSENMTPILVSVTFTDVTLTVTSQTGTTTATFPDIDP